jgi:hypothetical protein
MIEFLRKNRIIIIGTIIIIAVLVLISPYIVDYGITGALPEVTTYHGICTQTQHNFFDIKAREKEKSCNGYAWDNWPDRYCWAFDACMQNDTLYMRNVTEIKP